MSKQIDIIESLRRVHEDIFDDMGSDIGNQPTDDTNSLDKYRDIETLTREIEKDFVQGITDGKTFLKGTWKRMLSEFSSFVMNGFWSVKLISKKDPNKSDTWLVLVQLDRWIDRGIGKPVFSIVIFKKAFPVPILGKDTSSEIQKCVRYAGDFIYMRLGISGGVYLTGSIPKAKLH